MDMMSKGTLIRVCLAILFAVGFLTFLAPVFTGIVNIGNIVGMSVCTVLLIVTAFWTRLFALLCTHKSLRIASIAVVIIGVLLVVLAAVISAFMLSAANSAPPPNTTVIILGCKVRGEAPSLMLNKRIMAAYGYLSENPEAMCIVSGGQGSDELISEAECMKRVLVENGISEDRIIMEDLSTSTDENIRFSLKKMEEYGLKGSTAIVTSEFHQLRAKMIAEKYGLETYSWLREWFGVTYQVIFG